MDADVRQLSPAPPGYRAVFVDVENGTIYAKPVACFAVMQSGRIRYAEPLVLNFNGEFFAPTEDDGFVVIRYPGDGLTEEDERRMGDARLGAIDAREKRREQLLATDDDVTL